LVVDLVVKDHLINLLLLLQLRARLADLSSGS